MVVIVTKELSGSVWVPRFPTSRTTDTLTPAFQASVDAFKAAMEAGGANVEIDATFRPKERAYLMHWAHKIYRNSTDPATVPAMVGVNIEWVHPTLALSTAAAKAMVVGYQIGHLGVNTPPALNTLHTAGDAIDMSISWTGNLLVENKDGTVTTINTVPRTGMNVQLKAVGLTYGVTKFLGGEADRPHWSTTGR